MEGKDFLKKRREEKGFTVRQFAKEADVSPRLISYYEAGEKALDSIPLNKCIRMFRLLDYSVEDFYSRFFPYMQEIDEAVERWKKNNPLQYDYTVQKKRIYQRIAKIKERGSVDADILEQIHTMYDMFFGDRCGSGSMISEEDYRRYIIPIHYQIKVAMKGLPAAPTCRRVTEALYQTDYSKTDIEAICGISRQHLNSCITGTSDFGTMRIITVLKLCYLLGLNFEDTFIEKKQL